MLCCPMASDLRLSSGFTVLLCGLIQPSAWGRLPWPHGHHLCSPQPNAMHVQYQVRQLTCCRSLGSSLGWGHERQERLTAWALLREPTCSMGQLSSCRISAIVPQGYHAWCPVALVEQPQKREDHAAGLPDATFMAPWGVCPLFLSPGVQW